MEKTFYKLIILNKIYFNPNFLFEGISKNYSRRLMQSEPNMNARLIDKPRSNYSRNNPSLYFNETDFKDYNELLMMRSIPIEENKKKRKKEMKIYIE